MTVDQCVQQEEQRTLSVSRSQRASGEDLGDWLSEAKTLAKQSGSDEIAQEIAAVQAWIDVPVFRIAVVGAAGRGKSTLINRLLGAEVLPTGDVPTTGTTIVIAGADDEALDIETADGSVQRRQLNAIQWRDLTAISDAGDEREINVRARLYLNHPWLRAIGAEIVDTPGVADFSSRRSAIACEALHNADATIFVVAANAVLSLTERAFLEDEILGYGIGRAVVVLTMLDRVAVEQRQQVVRVLEAKIRRVSPNLPILPAHPVDPKAPADDALEVLRRHVEDLGRADDRRTTRRRQVTVQLARWLAELISIAQFASRQAQAGRAETEEAVRRERAALTSDGIKWEQIRIELDQRRIAHFSDFRGFLDEALSDLASRLAYDLDHVANLKDWCERELPHRLRQDLLAAVARFEASLGEAIERDLAWLEKTLQEQFDVPFERDPRAIETRTRFDMTFARLHVRDFDRLEILSRLGSGAVPLVGAILRGPLGFAVSLVVSLIGEHLVESKTREQRQHVRQRIVDCLETAFADYAKVVGGTLTRIYDGIAERTQSHQKAWRKSRLRVLENEPTPVIQENHIFEQLNRLHSLVTKSLD